MTDGKSAMLFAHLIRRTASSSPPSNLFRAQFACF
jgi:hypothetical protein